MNNYDDLLSKFLQAKPMLQAALDQGHGEYDLEDIWAGLRDNLYQLWLGPGFAAITEVINYPNTRMVLVHLAGGDLDALKAADEQLVQFAKIVDAKFIKIVGRRGWVRALKDKGYSEAFTQVIKEVQ